MQFVTKTQGTPKVEVGSVVRRSGSTMYYVVARDNEDGDNSFVLIGLKGNSTAAPFVSNFRYKDLCDIQRDVCEVYPADRVHVVFE